MPLNQSEHSDPPHYSDKEILGELKKILSSDLFSRSSVLSSFLKFIVEETIKGHTEGLKEYVIAVNALGKPEDFNPQIDAIVRIHAGRLRRLLKEYYTTSGINTSLLIEVVKGTYVPVFRPHVVDTLQLPNTEKHKPLPLARSKLTLAILPFRNLCPNNEYQFFVDGLGEEMTRAFSNYQDIAVIGHHSARKYAPSLEDIRVIGADLGAHYVITGSVKRSTKEIRVNVALVKTINGTQIWSHSYNEALDIDSLLAIQDQIVANVCAQLGGYYGFIIHEKSKTYEEAITTMESFDAALWNYYFHMNFSETAYLQTRRALEAALVQDPNFATGLAMLAELYLDAHALGYPTVEHPVKVAYELTKKAIKVDPQCQHAYQQHAWALLYMKQKEASIKALEHCIVINPSAVTTMGTVGFIYACLGDYKRAEAMLKHSINLNPHCPWWFYLGFFFIHYQKKAYDQALASANNIHTIDVFYDPLTKALAKSQLGIHQEAKGDMALFNTKFPTIAANLEESLSTILYDKLLIKKLLMGVRELGLPDDTE